MTLPIVDPDPKHPRSPCKTCPYRKDVAVGTWHRVEFEKCLDSERPGDVGSIFACHKHVHLPTKQRGMCAGWLFDQKRRREPSIMLRLYLRYDHAAEALERVHDGGHALYASIQEMCRANGLDAPDPPPDPYAMTYEADDEE